MPLDPVAQQMVDDALASDRPNAHLLPVPEARQNFEDAFAGLEKPDVAKTVDVSIPVRDGSSVRGRWFLPSADAGLPVVLYFHGGGWLLGSIDSHDVTCRRLALSSGAAVLSVDYRRGPESRFPVAVDDAADALAWLAGDELGVDVDNGCIALAGDSAGGNIAASLAVAARDSGVRGIDHLLLVYPVTTCDLDRGFDPEFEGIMLYRDEMQWHQDNYLPSPAAANDPRVAVLDADLAGLPETTVILAECDPIRPQGELMVDALRAAGVVVEVHQTPGMVHGFFGLDEVFPIASLAMAFAGERLAASLQETP